MGLHESELWFACPRTTCSRQARRKRRSGSWKGSRRTRLNEWKWTCAWGVGRGACRISPWSARFGFPKLYLTEIVLLAVLPYQ